MKLTDHSKGELIELAWRAKRDNLDPEAARKLFQTNPALPSEGKEADDFRKEWEALTKENIIQRIRIIFFDGAMNIKINTALILPNLSVRKGIENCWKRGCNKKSTNYIELGDLGDIYCCDEHLEEIEKELNECNSKGLIEVSFPDEE